MSVDRIETRHARRIEPVRNSRVRMTDLARLAGVSVATVSRSLSDSHLINRVTKRRVWQIASDHGYVMPRDMPEGLQGSLATLALNVPAGASGFSDSLAQDILAGMVEAARDARCDLMISYLPERQRDLVEFMEHTVADAFFFFGQRDLHDALSTAAAQTHKFIVWGDAHVETGYCTIGPDHFSGGYRATNRLIDVGCRRIAYLGDNDEPAMGQRFRGYLKALSEAGLSLEPDLLLNTLDSGVFDGLLCASDKQFSEAIRRLAGRAQVVGFYQGGLPDSGAACLSIDRLEAGRQVIASLLGAASDIRQVTKKLQYN